MGTLQKLSRQAWDVFRVFFRERSVNHDNLKSLQEAMTKIQASDLNIETTRHSESQSPRLVLDPAAPAELTGAWVPGAGGDVPRRAPVGYMQIFEDDVLTMGVFIIREGSRIPLHNHPGMHGLIKVLYGNLKIRSFNAITDDWSKLPISQFEGFPEKEQPKRHLLVPTRLGVDQLFTASSEAMLLTPREGNYHSLESVGGPAAFLDILAPPYDPDMGRDCYYFKELRAKSTQVQAVGENVSSIRWLLSISQPPDFWCDEVDYPGPDISITS